MKLTPLHDFVLLEADKVGEVTKGGMQVVKNEGERTESVAKKGKVIAIGSKVTTVKEGSIVWVSKWDSHQAHIQGKDYLVIKEKDILLVGVEN